MRFFIHVVHTISTLAIRGEVYFGVNLKSLGEVANKLKRAIFFPPPTMLWSTNKSER